MSEGNSTVPQAGNEAFDAPDELEYDRELESSGEGSLSPKPSRRGTLKRRQRQITKVGIVGIVANLLLVAFKVSVGLLANSIAVVLDGINNATDALSSIVTIIGTKLANRKPSYKHPFGYGRIEYLTSMGVAMIILAAGFMSLREAIIKIVHPGQTNYTSITIAVIVASILVKIALGFYFKRQGHRLDSQALVASGVDAHNDVFLSAGTLLVAAAQLIWNVNIDGLVGLIISIFVCKTGVDVVREAASPIIGERKTKALGNRIKTYIEQFPGVLGVYDLILVDFGPSETIGSLHIEVDANMPAHQIHGLTREITNAVYEEFAISVTVGIYAALKSDATSPIRKLLDEKLAEEPDVTQLHGFFVDEEAKCVYFDIVVGFDADSNAIRERIVCEMEQGFPEYSYNVVIDFDYA